jgi:hypothetical protein
MVSCVVTVYGFRGSTTKDSDESHQWLETCERMKKITLNLACRRSGSGELRFCEPNRKVTRLG